MTKIRNEDSDKIKSLYQNDNLSLSEIGKIFNCTGACVLKYMQRNNIPRKTVSDSLKGRSILWKDKISKGNKGKIISKDRRNKISKTRKSLGIIPYNKGLSKCKNPDIIIYGAAGEKHWNWKGGISSEQIRIRQSSEYKDWRKSCFKRDKYICQKCKKHTRDLQAHHIISFAKLIKEKAYLFDVDNGITLCTECHKECHQSTKS
jgi:hypothetical protein